MVIPPTELLNILSGRRNDPLAIGLRIGLSLLTPFYRFGIWWRNRFYERGFFTVFHVSVPVISIGNLTTGGTGKTPMAIWISRLLHSRDKRVVLISRGYGSENTGQGRNDEALELEQRLIDVPHLQDPDRIKMAKIAIEELKAEFIVLDDGFQHRRLARNLDIVLVDATEPFGFGHLIPRGLMREPVSSLSRANAVVLTRANAVDETVKNSIRTRVRSVNADAHWAETKTVSKSFLQFDGTEFALEHLRGKRVSKFCGIGNPAGFNHSLEQLDIHIVSHDDFPDHHGFTPDDLQRLEATAIDCRADAFVCTHKDLVKVGVNRLGDVPVYALLIEIEFTTGESGLREMIHGLF